MVAILLALFAFGIGKAALMPFHRWLPSAMVAPTPVSALLHAVAVVKAGVFTMLKVGIYIFGIDFLADTGASTWLMWLAAFSIIAASHAMGKITLFMCAGSIYVATHKTNISQMTGLGRLMPITFGAFLIGALSIIGLPPLGGSNVAYLLPIVGKGFFLKSDENPPGPSQEAGLFVWLPPVLTAFGCVVLFFIAGDIQAFLAPIVGAP